MPASSKRITYLLEKKKDKPASAAKKKERSVKKFGEMPDAAKNRAALFGNSHLFTNGRNRESMAISFYENIFLARKALPKTFLSERKLYQRNKRKLSYKESFIKEEIKGNLKEEIEKEEGCLTSIND